LPEKAGDSSDVNWFAETGHVPENGRNQPSTSVDAHMTTTVHSYRRIPGYRFYFPDLPINENWHANSTPTIPDNGFVGADARRGCL
jgi:hypothetical protein